MRRFPRIVWPSFFKDFMDIMDQLNLELFAVVPAECVAGRLGFYFEMISTLMYVY